MKNTKQTIKEHILKPLRLEQDSINNLVIGKIHLSDNGKILLKTFYREVETELREGGKYHAIKAYASKAIEQVCRIAGVLTLFECPNADYVSDDNIKNAIELMRYYLQEALMIADSYIIPPYLQKAEILRKWLIDEWSEDYINLRTIVQYAKGNFKTTQEARQAVNILVSHKWLIPCDEVQIINGHKSKEVWKINRGNLND